ncbi:hypothetical protein EC968_007781 [Mortierella alpina]|nr:hypothetical protein EC968_007781 [Mortierella alpina]
MAELLEAPKYFGDQEILENNPDATEKPDIHHYFNQIRNDKRIDGAIRAFANAWFRYLEGDAGALRIATAEEAAMNSIRNAKLAEQACSLAQIDMSGIMKKRQYVKAEQSASSGLGKHPREPEEKDDQLIDKPLAKKEANPFLDPDKEKETESNLDLDAASTAQLLSHLPLNLVFDTDDAFAFHGSLGDIDMSEMFSEFYTECLAVPFDPDNLADFLYILYLQINCQAIGGILFLNKQPTALQKKCFGDTYEVLHKKMKQLLPTVSKEEEKSAKAFCRDCRDVFRDEERRSEDRNKARKALRRRVMEEDESALTELYLFGQSCIPSAILFQKRTKYLDSC